MFSPDSIQQFSDIEEDSDDQSLFSENKESYKKDQPVKLTEGLKKIEARILAKQKEKKSSAQRMQQLKEV